MKRTIIYNQGLSSFFWVAACTFYVWAGGKLCLEGSRIEIDSVSQSLRELHRCGRLRGKGLK
jgi:hypothetical protein